MLRLLLSGFLYVFAVLNAEAAAPFDGLENDGAKVGYCFYAKSQQLQALARGRDPLQALTQVKVLEGWQATFNRVLPDRDQRNQQLAAALDVFNRQVSGAGVDGEEARAAVIESAMPACDTLMARSDLTPQVLAKTPKVEAVEDAAPPAAAPTAVSTLPTFRPRPDGTPFEKAVFAPGWRGDLLWRDQNLERRTMIASQDALPEAKQRPQIHLTLRVFGAKPKAHCIGALVESGVSADGLTLLARPAPGNDCGRDRVVRLQALAADRLRVVVEDGGNPVASGEFRPVNADARLPESPALLALFAEPEPKAAEPAVVTTGETTAEPEASETPPAQPSPRPVAVSSVNECATCLPIEATGNPGTDLFKDLFNPPLEGRFYWNWHESGLMTERTQGALRRLPGANERLRFSLTFESEFTALCVGTLEEAGRSFDGHMVHLRVADGEGRQCQPRVTHGYLNPYVSGGDPPVVSSLSLRLYDAEDRMVTNALLRTDALTAKAVDLAQATRAVEAVRAMEERAKAQRKDRTLATFRASPDYPRLSPFYQACLGAADGILGVEQSTPYCLCMAQKFGVGERIPETEFQSYARDFSRLVARFSGPHTEENKLYVRLDKTCKYCSAPGRELQPTCAEPDTRLYVASNYEQLIRLLDKEEPVVEATDYYKKVFFRTYLQGYSVFCEDQVIDPVRFDYVVTEYDVGDPWADPAGRVTQHDVTYVTRRYAERYERFRQGSSGPSSGQVADAIAGAAVTSEAQLRRRVGDVKRQMEIEFENRRAIRDHLQGQCRSSSVQRVYSNLDDLIR